MVIDRALRDPEDAGDLARGLPFAGPEQALGLALGQGVFTRTVHHAETHHPNGRLEDVIGHPGEDRRRLQQQIARGPFGGDEGEDTVLPGCTVQREGDAVTQPELGCQPHHVHGSLLQKTGPLIEAVPVNGQRLLACQPDHRIARQHVVFGIGLHPGIGALVEQHHLGPLHRHRQDQGEAIVVIAHPERKATDQFGQTIAVRHRSEMFEVLKQLVSVHMKAPLARHVIITANSKIEGP